MSLVLGTAGHVDHGKTALVLALSGHDTDRLPEEKARGISIALGFAPLALPSGNVVSLVDVPGHERFVRHMVAGASGVDGYLLCVAADDGVMPQTREHMSVLGLLDVTRGVVAITKTDLADPARAAAQVRELVGDAPEIVPVSSRTGEGVDTLRDALDRLAARLGRRTGSGRSRLFVDRAFSVAGAGTVVTGTLWGDGLKVDDRVYVIPARLTARVRGLQAHDRSIEQVASGRVAVNLTGVTLDQVHRGSCVVAAGDSWPCGPQLDVAIDWLADAPTPLRTRRRLQAFLGTAEIPVTCVLLDADEIPPGGRGYAQLRLDAVVAVDVGDRIVLRSAERRTVGGARVIDNQPQRHGRGSGAAERLAVLEHGDPVQRLAQRVADAGPTGVELDPDDVVTAPGTTVVGGSWLLDARVVASASTKLIGALTDGAVTVATALAATGLATGAAEALLDDAVRAGRVTSEGGRVRIAGAISRDPVTDAVAGLIAGAGRQPPAFADLVSETGLDPERLGAILRTLRDEGVVVAAGDLWFFAAEFEAARSEAVAALAAGPLGIGALRDLWGVGRRHALALASGLDAAGVTRRVGDERVLRRGAGESRESSGHNDILVSTPEPID